MSQIADYSDVIADSNLTMSQLKATLESVFVALASMNRGATAPTNPFEGMLWWDSSASPEILKRYTVTAGWVSIASINITTGIMEISGHVTNSLYDANTILAASSDNTPLPVTISEQTILGRKTGGSIAALTGAEVSSIIGVTSVLPWALLTDVKAANTDGGGATANTWHTRTLNTITGSEGNGNQTWCTLSSNLITFSTGTYFIEASAPAYTVAQHKLVLTNQSTSTDALIGTSERSGANYNTQTRSIVKGLVTVTSASHQYKLSHFTSTAQASNGLGYPTGSTANKSEIYAMMHIVKYS